MDSSENCMGTRMDELMMQKVFFGQTKGTNKAASKKK